MLIAYTAKEVAIYYKPTHRAEVRMLAFGHTQFVVQVRYIYLARPTTCHVDHRCERLHPKTVQIGNI